MVVQSVGVAKGPIIQTLVILLRGSVLVSLV